MSRLLWLLIAALGLSVCWPTAAEGFDLFKPWNPWSVRRSKIQRLRDIRRRTPPPAIFSFTSDRPFFTPTAYTTPFDRIQIETGYSFLYNDSDLGVARTHSLPELLTRVGVTDAIEFRAGWNYNLQTRSSPMGRFNESGASDLILGMKWNFSGAQPGVPATALLLDVGVPTGNPPFSSGRTDFSASLLYSHLLYGFLVGGSTGYSTATNIPGVNVRRDVFHQSVITRYPITQYASVFSEYLGLFSDELLLDSAENYFSFGGTYLISDCAQFDFRVGTGLENSANDLFTGIGLSVRM